jgi:hypothetical protein
MAHFTGNHKDYTVPQLRVFYEQVMGSKTLGKRGYLKKDILFKLINDYINIHKYSHIPLQSIVTIQAMMRKNTIQRKVNYQGLAILRRSICKNDEDFYTYDPKDEIEDKYFFSYKDSSHNHWCFDVRSIKKLLDMGYGNPYTTEPICDSVKERVETYLSRLVKHDINITIDTTLVVSRKAQVKQTFVDIFSQIEYSGYSCDVDWILSLTTTKLKRLYKELEDIWNYRANLSPDVKNRIVPLPNKLCSVPVHHYLHCHVKLELQEMLANELKKILLAETPSDMNLGFMYFIIALSLVNTTCYTVHPWVQYVF